MLDQVKAAARQPLVLLIGGDADSRLIFRTRLSDAGIEVITANDCATGLMVARCTSPDVVLLDVDLPADGSEDVARTIGVSGQQGDARVIALTRNPAADIRFDLQRDLFDQVLIKPIDPQCLLEAVFALLSACGTGKREAAGRTVRDTSGGDLARTSSAGQPVGSWDTAKRPLNHMGRIPVIEYQVIGGDKNAP